jgi:predicted  nucleic acid-binding Zn-ribbon protein
MHTFNEDQQSRREDSVCEINSINSRIEEIVIDRADMVSRYISLEEEIKSCNTEIKRLESELQYAREKHKLEFNETV